MRLTRTVISDRVSRLGNFWKLICRSSSGTVKLTAESFAPALFINVAGFLRCQHLEKRLHHRSFHLIVRWSAHTLRSARRCHTPLSIAMLLQTASRSGRLCHPPLGTVTLPHSSIVMLTRLSATHRCSKRVGRRHSLLRGLAAEDTFERLVWHTRQPQSRASRTAQPGGCPYGPALPLHRS